MFFQLRSVPNFSAFLNENWHELTRIPLRHRRFQYPATYFDDISIPALKFGAVNGLIQLSESPQVEYLNLLDYQKKEGDFHSTCRLLTVDKVRNFDEAQKKLSQRCCSSIFIAFLQHMKDVSAYTEDVAELCRKIAKATTKCARQCRLDYFRLILLQAVSIYQDSQPNHGPLFVTLLEHLCLRLELKNLAVDCIFLNYAETAFLRNILHAANKKRFDFWRLWERKFSPSDTIASCPVTWAYLSGKLPHLQVFLEHGFRQTRQRGHTIEEFFYGREYAGVKWFLKFFPEEAFDSRNAIVDEVILFLSLLPTDSEHQERLLKCFQLLWNARKDPFVTKDELLDAFNTKWAKHEFPERSRQQFTEGLRIYEIFLRKEEIEGLTPRTLQHLCKCTVRDILNDNWGLPDGVAKLPLPKVVKSYVLLETNNSPSVTDWEWSTWLTRSTN